MEDWQTEKSIIESNSFLINNETLSDISFSFPKEADLIYSHKFMLSKRSAVFFAMFHGGFDKPTQVVIEDASKESFLIFLNYVYTDLAEITPENVAELFYLGNKYLVKGLQNYCLFYVEKNISLDNVLCIASTSIKFVCENILDLCSTFIDMQCSVLVEMETFWNIDDLDLVKYILNMDKCTCEEINLFRGVLKWAQKYCWKNEMELQELTEVFELIRFPTMSVSEFAECANFRNIFSSLAEIGEIFCYITKKDDSDAGKYDKLPFKKINREMRFEKVSIPIENIDAPRYSNYYNNAMIKILVLENCFLSGLQLDTNDYYDFSIFKGKELIAAITENTVCKEYPLKKNTEYTFKLNTVGITEYKTEQGFIGSFKGRNIFEVTSESHGYITAFNLKVRC